MPAGAPDGARWVALTCRDGTSLEQSREVGNINAGRRLDHRWNCKAAADYLSALTLAGGSLE